MSSVLVIFNARLVDSCLDNSGMVIIQNQKILAVQIGDFKEKSTAQKIAAAILGDSAKIDFFDAKGLTLMPSFIDMHTHFRYPGQTQKEDLDSGLAAASAGGFGAVVTMANTNPVVSSAKLARQIMKDANDKKIAKLIQTVSITKDFAGEDTSEIDNLSPLEFPVISEDGRDVPSSAVMLEGMKKAGTKRIIVSCHCEDTSLAAAARPFRQRALSFMKQYGIPAGKIHERGVNVPDSVNFEIDGNITTANQLLALAEDVATERNIEIAKLAGCHVHICHCSTEISLDAVRKAKEYIAQGKSTNDFNCTVEVTPHHLGLVGTESAFLRALVNPPLRGESDRNAIIEAIKDGTVDVIATDHAPHTQEDKDGGSPGFTGLETAFAVCNTVLSKKENIPLTKVSELMAENPAKILKLNMGRLLPNYDANLVLVAPDEEWTCSPKNFLSKGKSSPFEGTRLTGRVHNTFFEGKKVYELK